MHDKDGHLQCATTSTYRAECPDPEQEESYPTIATVGNHTRDRGSSTALPITGVNSNAESYFFGGQKPDSAINASMFDMLPVSFSKPFVYAPLSDEFPDKVVNENFGYVPQSLIEWMAQDSDYVSKFPGIASCLPGGPSIDFRAVDVCYGLKRIGNIFLQLQNGASGLTVSSTVTIAGRGCFHPGACPTPAAPGATAVAATPVVTPEALPQSGMLIFCCLRQASYSC